MHLVCGPPIQAIYALHRVVEVPLPSFDDGQLLVLPALMTRRVQCGAAYCAAVHQLRRLTIACNRAHIVMRLVPHRDRAIEGS